MITLASVLVLLAQAPGPTAGGFPFFRPVQPPRAVEVVSHRVGSGLAPEDTARALEATIADAVEWAEVTVRRTRDGHHVLYRDDELDGRTDATGAFATAPSRRSAPPTRAPGSPVGLPASGCSPWRKGCGSPGDGSTCASIARTLIPLSSPARCSRRRWGGKWPSVRVPTCSGRSAGSSVRPWG